MVSLWQADKLLGQPPALTPTPDPSLKNDLRALPSPVSCKVGSTRRFAPNGSSASCHTARGSAPNRVSKYTGTPQAAPQTVRTFLEAPPAVDLPCPHPRASSPKRPALNAAAASPSASACRASARAAQC